MKQLYFSLDEACLTRGVFACLCFRHECAIVRHQDDVRQMLARVETPPPPAKPDKKLKEELLKMAEQERELLLEIVAKDQTKSQIKRS